MGLLYFLFAGTIINSVKKVRYNNSQPSTHGRVSDYDHGYKEGYYNSCYYHGYHNNYNCHDTYDCGGYDNDCENDGDWLCPDSQKQHLRDSNNKTLIHL